MSAETDGLVDLGMPESQARQFSALTAMRDFIPVVKLVEQTGKDMFSVFSTYLDVRQFLGYDAVLDLLASVQLQNRWDRLAQRALNKQFLENLVRLTRAVCDEADCNSNTFFSRHRDVIRKWQNSCQEIQASHPVNLHPFTVLAELIDSIID